MASATSSISPRRDLADPVISVFRAWMIEHFARGETAG